MPRLPGDDSAAVVASAKPLSRRTLASHLALAVDGRVISLCCLVGILAGLLATLYAYALAAISRGMEQVGLHAPVYVLMAAAGVLIGLCYRLGEPGETDAVVDNIHVQNGRIDTRANLSLLPISLLSISAGGSAGPEAPMVYLTGSVGTWLHRWLKLPEQQVRTLTFTGMAVGFATLFGAPVGSTLFALEIPHKRGMEYFEATVPSLIGCLVGYGLFSGLTHHGLGPVWHFPPYVFRGWRDLLVAASLGLCCGAASLPYIGGIHLAKRGFVKLRLPQWIKAALGGLILGLVAWKLPATRFFGEEQLQRTLIDSAPALALLLLLAAAKMLTVSVTLASGWRGGIIIPCFFIGACLGKAASLVVPGLDPTLAMVCGMAAMNVSVMKVPLATILVVAEMSGTQALPPIAVAAFSAFLVTGGVGFLDSQRGRVVQSVG